MLTRVTQFCLVEIHRFVPCIVHSVDFHRRRIEIIGDPTVTDQSVSFLDVNDDDGAKWSEQKSAVSKPPGFLLCARVYMTGPKNSAGIAPVNPPENPKSFWCRQQGEERREKEESHH